MLAYVSFFLTIVAINAIACLGLNLQWGFAGLFNVGVAGFVAVGAYTTALLTAAPLRADWAAMSCQLFAVGLPPCLRPARSRPS